MFVLLALAAARSVRRPELQYREESFICTVCTQIVEMVEGLLEDQKTEEEIEELLLQQCVLWSDPYKSICETVVQYVPLVMKLIGEGLETLDVCKKIGFCTETAKTSRCQSCIEFYNWIEANYPGQMTVERLWGIVANAKGSEFAAKIDESNVETFVALINEFGHDGDAACKFTGYC